MTFPRYGLYPRTGSWDGSGLSTSYPRANMAHYPFPGQIWHIIHRCHKKEFLLNIRDDEQLRWVYRQWIEEALAKGSRTRQPEWTESIAVGSSTFVEGVKKKLELRAKGRKIREVSTHHELREPRSAYNAHFGSENEALSTNNTFYLDVKT